jgi:hypothetical protein
MNRNLDEYIQNYQNLGFETVQEHYRFKRLGELLDDLKDVQNFKNILEIGPGSNSVYSFFPDFQSYTILEPISFFYKAIDIDNPRIVVKNETAEFFLRVNPSSKFDLVVLSSVLHELENPRIFLLELANRISPTTKIVVVLPNNLSLHRIIGDLEGFEKSGPSLTETERRMQQVVSFSIDSFTEFATSSGLNVVHIFTSFVKPLPHFKMHNLHQSGRLTDSHLDFLYSLSSLFDPYGSEIFAVLEKSND